MLTDREIAYEQNVSGLEIAWAVRLERFAYLALAANRNWYTDDAEGLRLASTEDVTARLLKTTQWENVTAVDISDIAYEAVGRAIGDGAYLDA